MKCGDRENAYHPIDPSHFFEVVFYQFSKANFFQKITVPAFHDSVNADGYITLFADDAAKAPLLVPSRNVRKSISQVKELALIKELSRHVVFEPKHFGYFHLDGHLAADITE